VRGRDPADSSLIARKLEDAELVLVAAPSYLKRSGVPATLAALEAHECIQFDLPRTGRQVPWSFNVDGRRTEIMTSGAYTCAEEFLGIVTLARSGAGIAQSYRFTVDEDLREGRLVELLPQHGGTTRPFILLYPHARHLSLRVRTFVDFLMAELGN
jgi:DNA-binding transcriptional LysR family regulator